MDQLDPVEEKKRVTALHDLKILGTPPSAAFDAIVETAATIFDCPTSLVSLMAEDRQWFKAKCGIDFDGTSRGIAFCDHTISSHSPLVVPDAPKDARFKDNPLVTGDPHIWPNSYSQQDLLHRAWLYLVRDHSANIIQCSGRLLRLLPATTRNSGGSSKAACSTRVFTSVSPRTVGRSGSKLLTMQFVKTASPTKSSSLPRT